MGAPGTPGTPGPGPYGWCMMGGWPEHLSVSVVSGTRQTCVGIVLHHRKSSAIRTQLPRDEDFYVLICELDGVSRISETLWDHMTSDTHRVIKVVFAVAKLITQLNQLKCRFISKEIILKSNLDRF